MRWLIALAAVVVGLLLGSLLAGQARRVIARSKNEAIRSLASPIASALFSICAGAGLVIGLGIASPKSVEDLPNQLIGFVPRLLLGVLVVIAGNGVATIGANAVGLSLAKATGRPQPALIRLVKSTILIASVVFAVQQVGVDTRLADMTVAAVLGCVSVSVALLTAFGGRTLAGELAAGRYLKRIVREGDHLEAGGVSGRVVHLHGATVELEASPPSPGDSELSSSEPRRRIIVVMPYSKLMSEPFRVERD